MLPTTKNLLIKGGIGALVVGAAIGGYYWVSSTDKGTGSGSYTDSSYTPSTTYGGAKTKHNRNHKKHNNKSRKHH